MSGNTPANPGAGPKVSKAGAGTNGSNPSARSRPCPDCDCRGGTRRGALVVISGPSGAGKTSICDELLKRIQNSCWSVSVTTRPRRGQEVDGVAYRFVAGAEFRRMVDAGELLEHAEYCGHSYGTPRKPVEEALAQGCVIIMEIDVQGAAQVAQRAPESIRVFVLPPTMATLQARLAGRHTESAELQRKRIAEADGEIAFARNSGVYPHFITNDILEDSVCRVLEIVERAVNAGDAVGA